MAMVTVMTAAAFGAAAAVLVMTLGALWGEPNDSAGASSAIEALTSRVGEIETKLAKSRNPLSDPAIAARIEALDKSLAASRVELAAARAQSEKLAGEINDVKSSARETSLASDSAAIDRRFAEIERATRAQVAALSQERTGPADDLALRRVVVASLLDISVRQGEPYAASLAAAKALTADADALKPLDSFATSGVPHAQYLPASCSRWCRNCRRRYKRTPPPAPASSIVCKQARRGSCASSARIRAATIAGRWSHASPRRRCVTILWRRDAS
jgi:hypothetical protein